MLQSGDKGVVIPGVETMASPGVALQVNGTYDQECGETADT